MCPKLYCRGGNDKLEEPGYLSLRAGELNPELPMSNLLLEKEINSCLVEANVILGLLLKSSSKGLVQILSDVIIRKESMCSKFSICAAEARTIRKRV